MRQKLKRAFDLFAQGMMSGFIGTNGGYGTMCGTAARMYEYNTRGA